jgi:hypothetical protein
MQDANKQKYYNKMIEAFVDKPEKTLWYQLSFSKFDTDDINNLQWKWSWWGFGTGFLFLLYRKQYIPALALFIVSTILGFLPYYIGTLGMMILSGGYSTYFIYRGFKEKLTEIETHISDEDERIKKMREVGGYHQWVIWAYIIFTTIALLTIFLFVLPLLSSLAVPVS